MSNIVKEEEAMAQKTVIELIDDIDGSTATETVYFGLDGASYAIDLNDEHIDALRAALDPYLSAARRGERTASSAAKPAASAGKKRTDLGEVREWANGNGFEVSTRGRVPQDVLDAFDAR